MKIPRLPITVTCLFVFATLFSACSKKEEAIVLSGLDSDHLVFGHFYGECFGETCVETFALTADKLYEDTKDQYGGGDFDFIELSSEKFNLATGLEAGFPAELLDASEAVFGCPDCGDWGGIYVEYVKDGVRQSWQIDVMLDDIPTYLHDFVGDIQKTIELINQ